MNNHIPSNILIAQKELYQINNLQHDSLKLDKESKDYSACSFKINNFSVKFRQAKITPTKIGLFVTFWKRSITTQEIIPFDASDNFDFFIVGVNYQDHIGQFIFPKQALIKNKVISVKHTGGKRAIRVYPPWDKTDNVQAKKTQLWQLPFFFDIHSKDLNHEKIKNLFSSLNK